MCEWNWADEENILIIKILHEYVQRHGTSLNLFILKTIVVLLQYVSAWKEDEARLTHFIDKMLKLLNNSISKLVF